MPRPMYRSKPFALTYAIRPATIADLPARNGSSHQQMETFSKSPPLFESDIRSLRRIHQGKVRDIYDVDADHLLIVTTDRLSAFDVVLPDPIPRKGEVLTRISRFWFGKTRHLIANHLTDLRAENIVHDPEEWAQVAGRAMLVKKLTPLPIE